MNFNININNKLSFEDIFYGLPEGTNRYELLKELPVSWNRTQE